MLPKGVVLGLGNRLDGCKKRLSLYERLFDPGGGTFNHYISDVMGNPNLGWQYTGTESCTASGCPIVCTERECSS